MRRIESFKLGFGFGLPGASRDGPPSYPNHAVGSPNRQRCAWSKLPAVLPVILGVRPSFRMHLDVEMLLFSGLPPPFET